MEWSLKSQLHREYLIPLDIELVMRKLEEWSLKSYTNDDYGFCISSFRSASLFDYKI